MVEIYWHTNVGVSELHANSPPCFSFMSYSHCTLPAASVKFGLRPQQQTPRTHCFLFRKHLCYHTAYLCNYNGGRNWGPAGKTISFSFEGHMLASCELAGFLQTQAEQTAQQTSIFSVSKTRSWHINCSPFVWNVSSKDSLRSCSSVDTSFWQHIYRKKEINEPFIYVQIIQCLPFNGWNCHVNRTCVCSQTTGSSENLMKYSRHYSRL